MWILLSNIDLRCFVARQFLSQIYALLCVKFLGLKMCECKKNDKYPALQVSHSAVSDTSAGSDSAASNSAVSDSVVSDSAVLDSAV